MIFKKDIAVIGGGAAGFFAAVNCAAMYPQHTVTIFEKSAKLLAKVRVSGGGRCNVTNACFDIQTLSKNYPRGEKQLKSAFSRFSVEDTIKWYEERGVKLKGEPDGRMFPLTDNSQTIVDCLLQEAEKYHVRVEIKSDIVKIDKRADGKLELIFSDKSIRCFDSVLIATGGNSSEKGFEWLEELGIAIVSPVPSLFTFNMPGNTITELMGVAVSKVKVTIIDTKFSEEGPLLITHWGMSGPAVLKLSAHAARVLAERNYHFNLQVNWLPHLKEEELRRELVVYKNKLSLQKMKNSVPFFLPKRLWEYFLNKIDITEPRQWAQLSKEEINKLVSVLLYNNYEVKGKTTFKEEFVTCGGVDLSEIDFKTMESKKIKGLYFAGEVMDVDAVTGGFNFQSAWTTGYIAAMAMGKSN